MKRNELYTNLKDCIDKAVRKAFPEVDFGCLDIELALVKNPTHGDLFTNIAFKIAGILKRAVPEVGRGISHRLENLIENDAVLKDGIKRVELKPPGFINFFVSESYLYKTIFEIINQKDKFGSFDLGRGERVQIEFVSANPTGPLSIAHGRQAAIGDALANILEFLGYAVTKEYYVNDEGTQIENLGKSIWVRFRQRFGGSEELAADGYQGDYVVKLAGKISPRLKDNYQSWDGETKKFFIGFGCREILKIIKADLSRFGVEFDNWVSQAQIIKSGRVEDAISLLKERGFIYEKDNALWIRSTLFGDDKDRVIVKSDGSFTYIASDIAYHKDKYERGFKRIIDIWGPDHHGYIPRLEASIQALGYDRERLKILISQLATLYRNGEPVPMSTRAGSFITLEEVITEVGKDVARFFFLKRKLDSHLDFDLDIAKEESQENPVYYIQYAYARISSILDYGKGKKIRVEDCIKSFDSLKSVLILLDDKELSMVRILQQFPYVLISASLHLEPNILIVYLENLAKEFHQYYTKYRVVGSEADITRARILLVTAAGLIIKNGLRLLGVSFPEKM